MVRIHYIFATNATNTVDALRDIAKISEHMKIAQLKGEVEADAVALIAYGEVDAYLHFSPAAAAKSTHILSCLMALKTKGRACLVGGIQESVRIPYGLVMSKSLQLRRKFMYACEAIVRLIEMIESSMLQLDAWAGLRIVGKYALADWVEAFDVAEETLDGVCRSG